jgi:hypothetical protein
MEMGSVHPIAMLGLSADECGAMKSEPEALRELLQRFIAR